MRGSTLPAPRRESHWRRLDCTSLFPLGALYGQFTVNLRSMDLPTLRCLAAWSSDCGIGDT